MALAWTGPWRAAPLLVRTHALALVAFDTAQSSACDPQLARPVSVRTPRLPSRPDGASAPEAPTPPRGQPPSHRTPAPAVNTRTPLLRLPGVDRVAVPGISASLAQTIVAESGTARSQGPDDQHWGAWRGVAPQTDSSGGKGLKSRPMQPRHRAAPAFRMAAPSVSRAYGAWGACSRRLHGRRGPAPALVATAHKSARPVDHRRTDRVPDHAIGAAADHQRFRERERHDWQKNAATLGDTRAPA